MQRWLETLAKNNIKLSENEPLSKHTTWRVGGPADAFVLPEDRAQLITTLEILNSAAVEWKVIGNGSNLLVSDHGFQGALISLTCNFDEISVENTIITVGAQCALTKLARFALENGLAGFEFAAGVPGTVGGAVTMNIGAHGAEISEIILDAEVLTETGEVQVWDKTEFGFTYRGSKLQRQKVALLSARFQLLTDSPKLIKERMEIYNERRMKSQPIGFSTAGSVFKNPENNFAGKLIEELGLKGETYGGAQVSTKHANFIVNLGAATSQDIYCLINFIQKKVLQEYGINLETEIEMVGKFDFCNKF
jgi:UDP-N-acetylmuramate dehydrogenase